MSCSFKLFKKILELSTFVRYSQVRHKIFTNFSPNAELSKTIIKKYQRLKRPKNKIQATYVWIDGTGEHVRCKTKTLDFKPNCVDELPKWSFDGSSTGLGTLEDSDVIMRPIAMYKDPFYQGGILVLCDTFTSGGKPTKTNHRICCVDALDQVCDLKIWFGMEQEFILMNMYDRPFSFMPGAWPEKPGRYYCGVGADRSFARCIIQSLYYALLYMDLSISGTNSEVLPGQWEYQIGPAEGVKCGDEIWIARYVLSRIAEEYGVAVTLDPKPMPDWAGSGLHTNFSTQEMRCDNGIQAIEKAIEKLKGKHLRHIAAYDPKKGEDNKRRLTGRNETANIKEFTSAVAHRGVSVRIPRQVADEKKGYIEDRRPASNGDPYSIINVIVRTCFLDQ